MVLISYKDYLWREFYQMPNLYLDSVTNHEKCEKELCKFSFRGFQNVRQTVVVHPLYSKMKTENDVW